VSYRVFVRFPLNLCARDDGARDDGVRDDGVRDDGVRDGGQLHHVHTDIPYRGHGY
jgi:hypothetical protein